MIELKNCGIGVETQSLSHSVESIDSQVGQLAGSSDIFLKIDIPSIVVSETMEM